MAPAPEETIIVTVTNRGRIDARAGCIFGLSRRTDLGLTHKGVAFHLEPHSDAADRRHLARDIRVAPSIGVSTDRILAAIEITLLEAGVVVFQHCFDVWEGVINADGIDPSSGIVTPNSPKRGTIHLFAFN